MITALIVSALLNVDAGAPAVDAGVPDAGALNVNAGTPDAGAKKPLVKKSDGGVVILMESTSIKASSKKKIDGGT